MASRFRFDLLAKAGYTARGVVFILVAGLALFSGVTGGQPEMKSALLTLLGQPFGRVWVGLIGLGLLGFVAWRLAQSLADSDGHGSGRKGLTVRSALFGSAAIYLGLAGYALGHALFFAGGDEESGEKGLAEWIMSKPFGSYLAIAVGIGFIVGGVVTAYKGLTRKFERYLRIPDRNRVLTLICIYGLVARGAVFVIIGILFAYAGFGSTRNRLAASAMPWSGFDNCRSARFCTSRSLPVLLLSASITSLKRGIASSVALT